MEIKIIDTCLFEKFSKEIGILLKENYEIDSEYIENLDQMITEKLRELKIYLENGSALFISAFERGELLGFLWAYERIVENEKRMHVTQFIVNGKYRGKGVGKKLLLFLEEETKKREICAIDLLATESNTKAINFYKNNDFKIQRVFMKKDLILLKGK